MVQKVIKGPNPSFIGGRLYEPGEVVDVDDTTGSDIIIPAGSTPIDNASDEELEAILRRRRGETLKSPADSRNLADPSETNLGQVNVPIADVAPRSAGTNKPQGAPAGSRETNGVFSQPTDADTPGGREVFTDPATEPGLVTPDIEPGASLTKAEIIDALKARGDTVDTSASKADLQAQLTAPPKA